MVGEAVNESSLCLETTQKSESFETKNPGRSLRQNTRSINRPSAKGQHRCSTYRTEGRCAHNTAAVTVKSSLKETATKRCRESVLLEKRVAENIPSVCLLDTFFVIVQIYSPPNDATLMMDPPLYPLSLPMYLNPSVIPWNTASCSERAECRI